MVDIFLKSDIFLFINVENRRFWFILNNMRAFIVPSNNVAVKLYKEQMR